MRPFCYNRRGIVAITLSLVMLVLIFSLVSVATLHMTLRLAQLQRAEHETQALYAAEAGLDVALQSRQPRLSGSVEAGGYRVTRRGSQLISLGSVEQANGVPVRACVTMQITPSGAPIRGTWQQVPPGRYPDLMAIQNP